MKKLLIILLTLITFSTYSQEVLKRDLTIQKAAPVFHLNGTAAQINFYNGDVVLQQGSNTLTMSGGDFSLAGGYSLLLSGSIGSTGARALKGWFTDLEITNAPTVNGISIATTYLAKADTNSMLSHYIARGDTSLMLTRYIARGDTNTMLSRYIARSDTSSMLSRYIARGDTSSMLSRYIARNDTAGMLTPYIRTSESRALINDSLDGLRGEFPDLLYNQTKVFNILDFGAVGDGITNNYAAIQDAIDSAIVNHGGIIFIPADGVFAYGTTLDMSYCRGVHLKGSTVGEGAQAGSLHFTGTGYAIKMSNDESPEWWLHNNTISDLSIYGNANCTSLIFAKYTGVLLLSNLLLYDCTDKAVYITRSILTTLDNVRTTYENVRMDYGIYLDSLDAQAQTTTNIYMPYMSGTDVSGIYLGSVIGTRIVGGAMEGNNGWGLTISEDANYTYIDNMDFEGNVTGGLHINGGAHNVFQSCYISDSTRIYGFKNIFKNCINTDDVVVASGSAHTLFDQCAFSVVNDSSNTTVYLDVIDPISGHRLMDDDNAYGIYNYKLVNAVGGNVINIQQRGSPGTEYTPDGMSAIKFGYNLDTYYTSARIGAKNEAGSNGGSWLYLQTHPRSWADTESDYTDSQILDPVGGISYKTSNTGTVTDATGLVPNMLSRFIYYSEGAATDISANPQIVDGRDGQIITILGSSDANTLTLDDGTGLALSGQCVLGIGDSITLVYNATLDLWIEISRSNN